MEHARRELGVLLLGLHRRERGAVRAVDLRRHAARDLLGLVLVDRLRVGRDRGVALTALDRRRTDGRVVVTDRRSCAAPARVVEAAEVVLAVHARAAALVLLRLLLGPGTAGLRRRRLGVAAEGGDQQDYECPHVERGYPIHRANTRC